MFVLYGLERNDRYVAWF